MRDTLERNPMDFIPCTLRQLPAERHAHAAREAVRLNPANAPAMAALLPSAIVATGILEPQERTVLPPQSLALLTSRYWGTKGVTLTVSFMEQQPDDVKRKIVEHMNAWAPQCNVRFTLTTSGGQVRISLGGGGYWSYLGTDVLQIPKNEQTMNLEGFTMGSPESEYRRVVRHETGHTLGFPHEHLRRELVQRLDANKTIAYFRQMAGWSSTMTRQQVLTPLDESSLTATPHADQDSIMTYQLPASITTDGQPIRGGADIDALDYEFAAKLYPPVAPPPPPPLGGTTVVSVTIDWDKKTWKAA